MAKTHSKQRAEDKLNLNNRIIDFVEDLEGSCKFHPIIVHTVTSKLGRMHQVRLALEKELAAAQSALIFKGVWYYLKVLSKIKDIKHELTQINDAIVNWINLVSDHLVPKILARTVYSKT